MRTYLLAFACVSIVAGLLAGCGGGARQVKTDGPVAAAPEEKKDEPEDLTERKVAVFKEPEYVEGVDREAQDAFRRGVVAIFKTPPDYAGARREFEAAVARDKAFMEAWANLGMTYERTGQPAEAIKVYERSLAANPGNLDAQGSVGKVYLSLAKRAKESGDAAKASQYETEAKKLFDAVIVKDPDNVTASNALALYWLFRGDPRTAEDFVKKVLMVQPKNVAALNTRGLINLMADKLSIARWVLEEKALKEDPNSTEAWTNLGLTYMKMGKTPQAVASFEKAVGIDADNLEARMNVGAIYLEYLHYQAALEQYDAVLKLQPDNVEAMIGSGSCLLGLHRPKEAVARWEAAMKVDPDRAVLYSRAGKVYETLLNDMNKAIATYDEYVRIAKPGPGDPIAAKLPVLKQMRDAPKMPEPAPTPDAKAPEGGAAPEAAGTPAPVVP
ncbi:MAG: tetratricopeptide repeat protein [Deltaproteobacteria bacterium]|nr:tetratricopeptide repeat protein [Deltaproteobacteria bacterium]